MARQFAADLAPALGERLASVVLHGSLARGEWIETVSDINVLVLLDDIGGASLGALSPVVRRFAPRGIRPIIIEPREWRRATDVFGIELVEMQDWHELLAGPDPLLGLLVSPTHLRLQAERELRGKLLQLHLGMVMAESPERLGGLLTAALPSIATYFRTALRLAGEGVARETDRALRDGCALVDTAPDALLRVLAARRSRKPLTAALPDPLVDDYNTAAERLADYIDNAGRKAS
ncbi:MAG TPA: nucleotidyltransferase domain-containing protein [Longimicrobiales bacterium]|nr:nucleotidyltransferase domain-containing protein [Longimicrobiales bacterium]